MDSTAAFRENTRDVLRAEDQPSTGAVDKAMAVLTVLIADGRPMRLAELTRRTGLAKPTVHRLIRILRTHKMIDQHDERYVPGERLAKAGRSAGTEYQNLLRQVSTPYLVDLYQATGATACLGVLRGGEIHYIDRIYGHRSVRTPSHNSNRAPAHCTAIGKVLLAHSQVIMPAALCAELSDIRRVGIAHNRDEYVNGVECVATLVVAGQASRPPVAIAVSGKAGQLDVVTASEQLRRTAFALSRAIRQTAAQIDNRAVRSRIGAADVPAAGTVPGPLRNAS